MSSCLPGFIVFQSFIASLPESEPCHECDQKFPARSISPSLAAGFVRFVSAPASPAPLAVFRIGVAAVLLFQALSLTQNLLDLYGARGVVQWQVMDSTVEDFMPRLSWVD